MMVAVARMPRMPDKKTRSVEKVMRRMAGGTAGSLVLAGALACTLSCTSCRPSRGILYAGGLMGPGGRFVGDPSFLNFYPELKEEDYAALSTKQKVDVLAEAGWCVDAPKYLVRRLGEDGPEAVRELCRAIEEEVKASPPKSKSAVRDPLLLGRLKGKGGGDSWVSRKLAFVLAKIAAQQVLLEKEGLLDEVRRLAGRLRKEGARSMSDKLFGLKHEDSWPPPGEGLVVRCWASEYDPDEPGSSLFPEAYVVIANNGVHPMKIETSDIRVQALVADVDVFRGHPTVSRRTLELISGGWIVVPIPVCERAVLHFERSVLRLRDHVRLVVRGQGTLEFGPLEVVAKLNRARME